VTGYPSSLHHAPGMEMRVRKDRKGFAQMSAGKKVWFKNYGDPDIYDKRTGLLRGVAAGELDRPSDVIRGEAEIQWLTKEGNPTNKPLKEGFWATEIQQHKVYHPKSSFYGFSDILPALGSAAGLTASSNFNLDFFFHGAVMTVAVLIEGFKATGKSKVVKDIKKFFEEDVLQNPHAALVLAVPPPVHDPLTNQPVDRPKISIKELQHPIRDGGWTQYRKGCRDEILSAHRVPPHMIASVETGNIGTGQGRSQMETFKQQVAGPRKERLEARLNLIFHEFGGWEISLKEIRTIDPLQGAQIAAIMSKDSLGSADEIRDLAWDLPPLPDDQGSRIWFVNSKTGEVLFVDKIGEQEGRELDGKNPAEAAKIIGNIVGKSAKDGGGVGSRKVAKYISDHLKNTRTKKYKFVNRKKKKVA